MVNHLFAQVQRLECRYTPSSIVDEEKTRAVIRKKEPSSFFPGQLSFFVLLRTCAHRAEAAGARLIATALKYYYVITSGERGRPPVL